MTARGHIRNGTIVLHEPLALPEGAEVEVDIKDLRSPVEKTPKRNVAELTKGINYDFDALERLRESSKL